MEAPQPIREETVKVVESTTDAVTQSASSLADHRKNRLEFIDWIPEFDFRNLGVPPGTALQTLQANSATES